MCLLVGPAAGGKTGAVRTLAALCGQPLLELSLTSGTDTSDLLGGFEQVEPARRVQVRQGLQCRAGWGGCLAGWLDGWLVGLAGGNKALQLVTFCSCSLTPRLPATSRQELAREVQALLATAANVLLPALRPADPHHQHLLHLLSTTWQACSAAAGLDAAAAASGAHLSAAPTAEAQHAQQVAAVQGLQQVLTQLLQLLSSLQQKDQQGSEASGSSSQRTCVQQTEQAAMAAGRAAELAAGLAGGAESAAGTFEWVDGALTR
jgi:midasin